MKDTAPQTIYLADYTPFGWIVQDVRLSFALAPRATRVKSTMRLVPNPEAPPQDFFLHGEDLTLIRAAIDGVAVTPTVTEAGLTIAVPEGPFTWEAEVEIAPVDNTALEGLYMSNGMYCTQCEAEGFRKITYYPDRPDVMAPFTVRIEGDAPIKLSNGNPTACGDGYAEWTDPWPKPAYLFALVAGDLVAHRDRFTTRSGREVDLNLWVRPGDEGKCAWGMEALKKSMTWDEEVYGREYDLDVFNIVAVDDFNMGAMENKGLNIFNSAAVLASPETATDANFERIESIIAHEYFHNWTGNRITCRDWFQLCLKEGLTVFRDQQFTADLRSAAVKRIDDVAMLRARQFPEDQGPLAHPVRPESFQEINNFYTATVYEKGAEVIGMLKTLVGDAAYARALDLYFDRHDGQACTIEDWLKVFEDTTDRDLTQFKRWYSQAGTPRLSVTEAFADGTYTLTLGQTTPPTPGQEVKEPLVIPVAVGLLGKDGSEVAPTRVLELTDTTQSFTWEGLDAAPVPSILRGFSAPVVLDRALEEADWLFLLRHDTDPFNRWEAARTLARDGLVAMLTDPSVAPSAARIDALRAVVSDTTLEPAFRDCLMDLPSQAELARHLHGLGHTPDPYMIFAVLEATQQMTAERWAADLPALMASVRVDAPYAPDADQSGRRALGNALLGLQSRLDKGEAAQAQFENADNMTAQIAALGALVRFGGAKGDAALAAFEAQWRDDRLVMDKWFALQIAAAQPEDAAAKAKALTEHPAFDLKNPNRFRAVFGALAGNHAGFHHAGGAAYDLLADWLIKLDDLNPQTTARMCGAVQSLNRYDAERQAQMRAALTRIAQKPRLSRDTGEMVSRILA